jgi:replicative DNA helicase
LSNFELQLVSRIIRTGSIKEVLEWGTSFSDFKTAEGRAYFKLLCDHFHAATTLGTVVGPHSALTLFPQLQLHDDPSVTTQFLCQQVRQHRLRIDAKQLLTDAVQQVDGDVAAALNTASAGVQRLIEVGAERNTDVSIGDALERIWVGYEAQEQGINPAKMQWPWEVLNECTGGIQQDDYIVFYGRPKSMKTFVLCVLIAWAFQQDKLVLVYTKEMTPDNIFKRVAACIAELPYQDLRAAKLSPEHRQAFLELKRICQDPRSRANIICLSGRDAGPGNDTVAWLQAKVQKYKPDILFVDGMYLLSDEPGRKQQSDHIRVMNISRGLRALAMGELLPVIATMQANRKAAQNQDANLDEIAYSDALAQDATIAIRTIAEKKKNTIACVIGGSREFDLHGFRINAVPCEDFTYHSTMMEADVLSARTADGRAEEIRAGSNAKGKKGKANQDKGANGRAMVEQHIRTMEDGEMGNPVGFA